MREHKIRYLSPISSTSERQQLDRYTEREGFCVFGHELLATSLSIFLLISRTVHGRRGAEGGRRRRVARTGGADRAVGGVRR